MAENYSGRTLRELVRVMAGRFVGMAIIVIVVVGAAAAATYFAPRTYRSEVRLKAAPTSIGSPLETRMADRDEISLYVGSQRELILSDYVLAAAMDRLDKGKFGEPGESYTPPSEKEIANWISANQSLFRKIQNSVSVVTPGGTGSAFTQMFQIRVDWSEQFVPLQRQTAESRQKSAERAQEVMRCILAAYLDRNKVIEGQRSDEATAFLRDTALDAARKKRDKAQAALQLEIETKIKGDLPLVLQMYTNGSSGEMGEAILRTRSRSEIITLNASLAEISKTQESLKAQTDNGLAEMAKFEAGKREDFSKLAVPEAVLKGNDTVAKLQERLTAITLELTALRTRYTDTYQQVADLRRELSSTYGALLDELQRHAARLEQERQRLTSRRDSLVGAEETNKKMMDDLALKVAEYQRLRLELDSAQAQYDKEDEQLTKAVTAGKLSRTPILISTVDPPTRPDPNQPYRPIVWLNLAIALLAAVTLALIYAFMADHFDHTIKSIDDAERYLGVPVLGSVPKLGRNIIRAA
ncbi:MAG: hypothetical protein ABFD85_08665 [Phycisphaerae bacterium]